MGVWSHFILVFKKETRFWKIQTESVVEAVNALKISFLSDLITIGLGLFLFFTLNYVFKFNKENAETLLGLLVFLMLVVWFFSIPLLYEKALVKRKSKTKQKTKPNKK
jgi:predicted permease